MSAPIFIGDEVTAAGYRLAGARVRMPEPAEIISTLHWARSEASLVLITADYAAQLPAKELRKALGALQPLVVIVPDARGTTPVPDLAAELRGQMGVEL